MKWRASGYEQESRVINLHMNNMNIFHLHEKYIKKQLKTLNDEQIFSINFMWVKRQDILF